MASSDKRICDRTFQLLATELQRLCADKPLEEVRRSLVLKRLERFRQQVGPPLTYAELKDAVDDIFPEFDDRVLRQAARINQPNPIGHTLGQTFGWGLKAAIGVMALAGGLWVINLPYPMIRWPVAKVSPMLLLPSFMAMDHNYRQSIIYVEQADQLINNATSKADFDLGAEKAQQAQKYLDRLPVWFLGYYPQRYCQWFSCGWQFTLDEFEGARALIGRMEAQIFQEQNALTLLDEGTLAVETAKRRYEAVQTFEEKLAVLDSWQTGMDKLNEIPAATLAGETAQTRLQAFQRDYATLAGTNANVSQSDKFVQAAKQFALQASQIVTQPPYPATTWKSAVNLWDQALGELKQVPPSSPSYTEARTLLAKYSSNLEQIRIRQANEEKAVSTLENVRSRAIRLIEIAQYEDSTHVLAELQTIIYELKSIPPGTTAAAEATTLVGQAEAKLAQLQAALKKAGN